MSQDGVLVVDKPIGPTSHDVVSRARRAFGTRAVGHAGTLDPLASGVLVILVNEGTKLSPYLSADDKAYEATIRLGSETDTLDAQGEVTRTCEVPSGIHLEQVRAISSAMCGVIQQVAPVISAIKVEGRTLYSRARSGETVEAPTREVLLRSVDVRALRENEIDAVVDCGKGFYVRSFARDLGVALGTCAHLAALRRTRSGSFTLADACAFDVVNAAARGDVNAKETLAARLISLERASSLLPRVDLNELGTEAVKHGRKVGADGVLDAALLASSATVALFDTRGLLVAIGAIDKGLIQVMRGIVRKN